MVLGMPTEDLLTTAQAADMLGVSVWAIHRRVAARRLKAATKLPGTNGYVFHRADVERLAATENHTEDLDGAA
jgi:excisionase family DNA binding protein